MQRVVQLIPDFGLGGVQKAGCVLGQGLAELGCPTQVVGLGCGPRYRDVGAPGLSHIICSSEDDAVNRMRAVSPDVIHLHAADYREPLLRSLREACPDTLIVSTPVFGRPPNDRRILETVHTCTVGVYTFYRLCRWLGISASDAVSQGVGFVPLTPYLPSPRTSVTSAYEGTAQYRQTVACLAREGLHLDRTSVYIGRIGRDTISKWYPHTAKLVDSLLMARPRLRWLSIGMPAAVGADDLRKRWGDRFLNLPETQDAEHLEMVTAALDMQVFFSRHGECFASSIAEAAGAGVPSIALATPFHDNGQAEQVIDGTTGYLVANVAQAVERVSALCDSPTDLLQLQLRTTSYAHGRWHYKRVAADLLQLYRLWQGGKPGQSTIAYIETILEEEDRFSRSYKNRVSALASQRLLPRMGMQAALTAYENWHVFRAARSVKAWAALVPTSLHAL